MAKQQIAPERGTPDAGWIIVASQFPAGLNKLVAPEVLRDGQTPESWGQGLEKPGYLYAGTPVAGYAANPFYTAVSAPTGAPEESLTWYWWFNRLWAISGDGKEVYYGAHGYKDAFVPQGRIIAGYGATSGQTINTIAPVGNNLALFYDDAVDVVPNAGDPSARFGRTELVHKQGCAASGRAVAIGERLYYINANGVWNVGGYIADDVTAVVRNSLAPFTTASATALQSDERRQIVAGLNSQGAIQFAIDASAEQPALYDYSQVGFRFTSTTLMAAASNPLVVDKLAISYETDGSASRYSMGFDVKINDAWHSEGVKNFTVSDDKGRQEFSISGAYNCRRWAVRLTSLSSGLYISNIQAKLKQGGVIGYSN